MPATNRLKVMRQAVLLGFAYRRIGSLSQASFRGKQFYERIGTTAQLEAFGVTITIVASQPEPPT